jgi:hypothetical protein
MNKTALLFIIAIIGFAILTVGILVYLGINSSNQSVEPANVTITSFNLTGYNNPVGVVWNDAFVLNYTNNGLTDVNNVTIAFTTNSPYQIKRELSVFDSAYPHYYISALTMGESYLLGVIKAGEYKEFHGEVWNNLEDAAKMGGYAFFATLKSNDTILDQAQLSIPKFETHNITCTYHQISLENIEADTKVAFLVTANINNGSQATLSFDKFYLTAMYSENVTTSYPITHISDVAPWETGSITLDNGNRTSSFQLTFQFPSYFRENPVSSYTLAYSLAYSNSIEVIHEGLLDNYAINKLES